MSDPSGYLDKEEVEKVLQYAKTELDRIMIKIFWKTGCRVDELVPFRHSIIRRYKILKNGKRIPLYEYDDKGRVKYVVDEDSGLKKGDINFKRCQMTFRNLKRKRGKKEFKIVDIEPEFAQELNEFTKDMSNDQVLFPYSRFQVDRIFKKMCYASGFNKIGRKKPHIHVLRHSFAMQGINKVPIHFIQQQLGHSSLAATQFYFHIKDKDRKKYLVEMWK